VNVTPRIFSDVTRSMSGRTGGGLIFCRRYFSVNTISTDLDRFNVRQLSRDHAVILSSSVDLEPTVDTYVSSAYLHKIVAWSHSDQVGGSNYIIYGANGRPLHYRYAG